MIIKVYFWKSLFFLWIEFWIPLVIHCSYLPKLSLFYWVLLVAHESLATCARKPKVLGSSPAAVMCRGELSAVIAQLMSKCVWSGWKWSRGIKEIASPFPCCPVNHECSWKKSQKLFSKADSHLPRNFVLFASMKAL